MATPVYPSKTTGDLGEQLAKLLFTKMGWAPPAKLGDDIGTDFITFARDVTAPEGNEGSWDIGAPVFFQVKGSRDKYTAPDSDDGGAPGWWFAESTTYHFDHWLSFGLPYLLVLVEVTKEVGYWAEVTGDAIVDTGKGRKLFVPATQRVDTDNLEALNRVAVSRRRYDLEGAAWRGKLNDLAPADRLRNALLLPRLVAPHPNRSPEAVRFEEAVAMVMRNRVSELRRRSSSGLCPEADEWKGHKDWGWRFVHALIELVARGDGTDLAQLATDARHQFEMDACNIVGACADYEDGNAEGALSKLVPGGSSKPADLGWLETQTASFLLELGQPEDAAEAATRALTALRSLDGDPTVSVIRGSAASILYAVADRAAGHIEATVTAQDNAGSWWRAQDVSWALEKDLGLRFRGWAEDDTVHFVEGTSLDELAMAAWNAALSGSWGSWRHLAALRAQLVLTSTDDREHCREALARLVFVGEKQLTRSAVRRIWQGGPAESLHVLVSACVDRPWARRDEGATLAVFAEAGDLLDSTAADHVVQRVIDLLIVEGEIRVHGADWSLRWAEADAALHRVLTAASTKSHEKVADLIASRFGTCDDFVAHCLVRVAGSLDWCDLDEGRLNLLVEVARRRNDHYRLRLLEILAANQPEARADLRRLAESGNDRAVRSLLVAGSRDPDDFLVWGRTAAQTVGTMIEDARGKDGQSSMTAYANDPLDDLTLAAFATNDGGLWMSVTDALQAGVIDHSQLHRALFRIAIHFHEVPQDVQNRLRTIVPHLTGSSMGLGFGLGRDEFDAAVIQLHIASGMVSDIAVEALLLDQLRANPAGFARNLVAWRSASKLPYLATLIFDSSPQVRARAAFGIIEHAQSVPEDNGRAAAFIRSALVRDNGYMLADGVAQGLAAYPDVGLDDMKAALTSHRSAIVRRRLLQSH